MALPLTPWTFTPLPPLPPTLLPNIVFYNATNPPLNKTYQISISYPFEWGNNLTAITNKTALTMYVLDGNALGLSAAEAFKRRKPVDSSQPDAVVVTVGYPLTDAVYGLAQRRVDFRPPLPEGQVLLPGEPESGADAFIEFIDGALRPWVRGDVFHKGVEFTRDALYGHSFGGLFAIYALTRDPRMFDTIIAGSPATNWNNGSILGEITTRFGDGIETLGNLDSIVSNGTEGGGDGYTKPAVFIGYGGLEQFPVRRRTQNESEFQTRKNFYRGLKMTDYAYELFDRLKGSGKMRDVVLKEYIGQDHSGVGGSALTDGIDYFLDWP